MKKFLWLFSLIIVLLTVACGPSAEQMAIMVGTAQTATAGSWTMTSTPTLIYTSTGIFTLSSTYSPTETPTNTSTPTFTFTPSFTPSATFDFPTVTVNVANAACMWGPSTEYLWGWDLKGGDTGIVYGRSPYNGWLYVKMSRVDKYCWISPYVVDIIGDPKRVIVETIRLPITNALYAAPTNVQATRDGDKVTVTWDEVWMTVDDDNGYFIDAMVCQNGNLVWMPVGRLSLPDHYHTSYTFTDQEGCSEPSSGMLYTVEKHGYTDPVTIPWPPYK